MMKKLLQFVKHDAVLAVSCLLALLSAIFVPLGAAL